MCVRWELAHVCDPDEPVGHVLGFNNDGQLGQGDNVSRGTAAMPMSGVRVIGIGMGNVLSQFIACGEQYVCVMTMNATIRCWRRWRGPSGMEANVSDVILPGDGKVIWIATGGCHTCVIMRANRKALCWGWGMYGQLGRDSSGDVGDSLGLGQPPLWVRRLGRC